MPTNQAGETALHIAAGKGSATIVQLLVDKGTKLDVKDTRGMTPLALAEAPTAPDNHALGSGEQRMCFANWARNSERATTNGQIRAERERLLPDRDLI